MSCAHLRGVRDPASARSPRWSVPISRREELAVQRFGGSSPQAPPRPVAPPTPSGCASSPTLLRAGLHKMDFPGCANLAATCSRCAGASKMAQLQTQSSWESGCQASSSPLPPPLLPQWQQLDSKSSCHLLSLDSLSRPCHSPCRPGQPSPDCSPAGPGEGWGTVGGSEQPHPEPYLSPDFSSTPLTSPEVPQFTAP